MSSGKEAVLSSVQEAQQEHLQLIDYVQSERANTSESQATDKANTVGTWFLTNMWYFAAASNKLKPGKTLTKVMLGQPVLIGRDRQGKLFAMVDICPHQGIPLSDGWFNGTEVTCCFHGWTFDTNGVCTSIPSLVDDQKLNICKIKTKSFPCQETMGSIWVYFGDKTENLPAIPQAPGLDGLKWDKTITTLPIPTHIDFAAAALIDPAHVPYVHKSWWWRSAKSMKEKYKHYVPDDTGWTMVRHRPSPHSIVFKLFGKYIETEIGFRLPGCRIEQIIIGGRTILSGITTLTPVDETNTELNHTTYWTIPYLAPLLTPIINYFVTEFLSQDKDIAIKQQVGLRYKTNLIMTVKDAGTPGRWYFQLKKAWADASREGRAFINPVKESYLRWRS
jgi:phenylpropionate dioxygenase-like ring-hydroxylating dioxygenase large terminal subunit